MTSFEKPTKATRPSVLRKKEIRKADREWQSHVPEEGNCEVCGLWKPLVGDHKIKRRHMETRFDLENQGKVCSECNVLLESMPKGVLLQRFPDSPYADSWRETIEQKRFKPYTSGFPIKK